MYNIEDIYITYKVITSVSTHPTPYSYYKITDHIPYAVLYIPVFGFLGFFWLEQIRA